MFLTREPLNNRSGGRRRSISPRRSLTSSFLFKVEPDNPDRKAPIGGLYLVQRRESRNGQKSLPFGRKNQRDGIKIGPM